MHPGYSGIDKYCTLMKTLNHALKAGIPLKCFPNNKLNFCVQLINARGC